MKKIYRTIKLRKFKTKLNEEAIAKFDNHEFIVCFDNDKWLFAYDKYDLRKHLERDHINPIRYIFDVTDRIVIDRDVLINTDVVECVEDEKDNI